MPAAPRKGERAVSVPGCPAKAPDAVDETPQSLLTTADFDAADNIERAQTLIEDPLQFEQDQIDGFLTREFSIGECEQGHTQ